MASCINNNPFEPNTAKVEVLVQGKNDKTLKNNIDAKNETMRKRTSLIIVPQTGSTDNSPMNTSSIENNDDLNDNHALNAKSTDTMSSSPSSTGSADSSSTDDLDKLKKSLKNTKNNRHSIASVDSCVSSQQSSSSSSAESSSSESSSGDDVILEDYQDLENGNVLDELDENDRKNCISNASSSLIDDYSLREKLNNFVNISSKSADSLDLVEEVGALETIDDQKSLLEVEDAQPQSLPIMCTDTLLSPHEVPMGRRYGGVAQFNKSANKR